MFSRATWFGLGTRAGPGARYGILTISAGPRFCHLQAETASERLTIISKPRLRLALQIIRSGVFCFG